MQQNLTKIKLEVNFDMPYDPLKGYGILIKNGDFFSNGTNLGLILRPKYKNGHISGMAGPISKIFEI